MLKNLTSSFVGSFMGSQAVEQFVAVDIGSSSIKVLCLGNTAASRPMLVNAGIVDSPAHSISNNIVVKPSHVGSVIRQVLDENEIKVNKAVFALPAPAVFTKRVNLGYYNPKQLKEIISFEASNYIPHSIDAVCLDYQVVKVNGKTSMDVLLVAVKKEIINSYAEAVADAGLEPAIGDVDIFALENMFEICYPEELKRCVAVLNIGSRYTSVAILQDGLVVFSGDVAVGGRLYTDALSEALNIEPAKAEDLKKGKKVDGVDASIAHETLDRVTEHVASELHRQIGFFWNAAATDRPIEAVYVSGAAADSAGLIEDLSTKTQMKCLKLDPFRGVDWSEGADKEYIDEIRDAMAVCVGLGRRRFGDKPHINH